MGWKKVVVNIDTVGPLVLCVRINDQGKHIATYKRGRHLQESV